MTEAKPEGLRARKRRATENAIETSALKLALDHGVENVTVEAICEMADISRSTFFNYFAARDYAIVGRALTVPEAPEAFELFNADPANLPLGVYRMFIAALGHNKVNTDVARLRAKLIAEQPEAARMSDASLAELVPAALTVVGAWLTVHPEHRKLESVELEAYLTGSIVYSVFVAQMSEWRKGQGEIEANEQQFAELTAAIGKLLPAA